jgi:Ras-related protein Rab-5C
MSGKKAQAKKVVCVGDAGVGKTCLIHTAVRHTFIEDSQPTVGSGFEKLTVPGDADGPITFEIWDTAGQERYRALTPRFFNRAVAAIFVFDITNSQSLPALRFYHESMSQVCPEPIVIVLVGNKVDLEDKREVPLEDVLQIKDALGVSFYCETSAKTGQGVMEIFSSLARAPRIKESENQANVVPVLPCEPTVENKCAY